MATQHVYISEERYNANDLKPYKEILKQILIIHVMNITATQI